MRDDTYVQVSPLARSEESIGRLEDARRRLCTATGAKVSTVKVLRESLARGLEAREHTVAAVYRDVGMSGAEWVRRRGLLDLQVDAARTPRPWDILLVREQRDPRNDESPPGVFGSWEALV